MEIIKQEENILKLGMKKLASLDKKYSGKWTNETFLLFGKLQSALSEEGKYDLASEINEMKRKYQLG